MTKNEKRALITVLGLLLGYFVLEHGMMLFHVPNFIDAIATIAYAILTLFVVVRIMGQLLQHDIGLKFTKFATWVPLVCYVIIVALRLVFGAVNIVHYHFEQAASLTLRALEAGILEETILRAGIFYILLRVLQKRRNAPFQAAIYSSVFFGLLHLTNMASGQDLTSTLSQVLFATWVGLIFTAIYARTGSILYGIILHFAIDFNRMAQMGTTVMSVPVEAVAAQGVVLVIVLIIMIFGVFPNRKAARNSKLLGQ